MSCPCTINISFVFNMVERFSWLGRMERTMADDQRRRLEMEAALKQIKDIQKRQVKKQKRNWRLDVSLPRLAFQGLLAFIVGMLVGLGAYVLFNIVIG